MPIKILALDDSKTMRMAVKVTFAAEDADVTSAGRSAEFFEKAKSQKPDVILLDYRLDSADPAPQEICAKLREEAGLAEVPVVLMLPARDLASEGGDNPGQAKMLEVGADAVIGKPFPTQDLIDLVWKQAKTPRQARQPAAAKTPAASQTPVAVATSGPAAAPKKPVATPRPAAAPRTPAAASGASPSGVRLVDRNAGGASGVSAPRRPVASPAAAATSAAARATASAPSSSPQSMDIPLAIPIPFVSADAPPPKMLERIEAAAKKGASLGSDISPEALKALAQLSQEVVERIAWEIMPDLAESIVKERSAQQ